MSELRIARGFGLPLDVAGETLALLGKRGSGKTNTGRVLAEELVAAHVQTVVLDPVGAWWGLRSSADGKGEGLPLPILGGAHGDVPLEPTAGRLLADIVVDTGQSLVLDLSDFSKTQQRQFVVDFAERLYQRKARAPELLHLILEETDEFAPQRVSAGDARMVGAIEQLVRRGRGRGIGLTMITQRSASLNKAVLEQTDVLLAMRTTGPRDRAAIEAWVSKQDVEDAELVLPSLPSLETGEAWVWNPERGVLQRVRIRLAHTYDSSSTAKVGRRKAAPKKTAPIDLTALGEQIAATVEKAKESDPAELRKRIRELERENLKAVSAQAKKVVEVEKVVEVPVPVFNGEVDRLEEVVRELTRSAEQLHAASENVGAAATAIAAAVDQAQTATRDRKENREPAHASRQTTAAPGGSRLTPTPRRAPLDAPRPAAARPAGGSLTGPQQRILNALAALEHIGVEAAAKAQVALFAEASPKSSSYTNNLGHLKSQLGLIDYPSPGRVALTDAGRELADAGAAPATVEELHRYVAQLVGGARWRLLEQLIAVYPRPIEKDELAARAGASPTSSSFTNNLGSLRKSLGLIDYPGPGLVRALPVLFMEGS